MSIRRVIVAAIACVATTTALASDPERLAEARAVLKAMDIEKQLDQLLNVMSQELTKVLIAAGGPAGKDPRVAQVVVTEAMAMSRENAMRPGGLMDTVAELYAEKLSIEDLRAIRAFHESPASKRLQQATPELMQAIIQRSMLVNRQTLPGLCARVKQRLQRENFKEAETFGCPAVWS